MSWSVLYFGLPFVSCRFVAVVVSPFRFSLPFSLISLIIYKWYPRSTRLHTVIYIVDGDVVLFCSSMCWSGSQREMLFVQCTIFNRKRAAWNTPVGQYWIWLRVSGWMKNYGLSWKYQRIFTIIVECGSCKCSANCYRSLSQYRTSLGHSLSLADNNGTRKNTKTCMHSMFRVASVAAAFNWSLRAENMQVDAIFSKLIKRIFARTDCKYTFFFISQQRLNGTSI